MRTNGYLVPANIEAKTAQWLSEIRNTTAPRPQLVLNPALCALLIVDMNNYFTSENGRCFLPSSAAIVPNIRRLVSAWRSQDGTVIYTKHCHHGPEDLGMLGKFFSDHIRANSTDGDIIPSLEPLSTESVFEKNTYDAFLNTPLQSYLEKQHITQVLITGVLTHMCCETTARSAFCRGFEVYVPIDATATTDEERHLQSLKGLATAVARIITTEEAVEKCHTTR